MQVLSGAGLFTAPGAGSGVHWVEHLRASDLSVGTYSVPAGADDDQEPHTEDEIYVVTAGQATLEAGGQAAAVGPGSAIYVPAGTPHHLTGATSDLALLVLPAPAQQPPPADRPAVLAERNFRGLFATRLISQAGDGIFTAGLGAYVFFNATTFPDPGAAAAAFAVLYLPYSLVGPFAGVFIDRWSRRQILVWSAVLRASFVVLTASLVASGRLGVPLYVGVLAVLAVNRCFLSSLSA